MAYLNLCLFFWLFFVRLTNKTTSEAAMKKPSNYLPIKQ